LWARGSYIRPIEAPGNSRAARRRRMPMTRQEGGKWMGRGDAAGRRKDKKMGVYSEGGTVNDGLWK